MATEITGFKTIEVFRDDDMKCLVIRQENAEETTDVVFVPLWVLDTFIDSLRGEAIGDDE